MKKIFAVLVLSLLVVFMGAVGFAADQYVQPQNYGSSLPFIYQQTVMSAQSTTPAAVASTTYKFGMPMSRFICQGIFSGATNTATTFSLDGTANGTTWTALATSSTVSNAASFTITSTATPVDQIRGQITSTSNTNTATKLTVKCDALQ